MAAMPHIRWRHAEAGPTVWGVRLTLDNPPGVAAPFGDRFAHVARLDGDGGALLMLAGQVAVDDTGEVVAPGDAGAQAQRIFEIVEGVLAAHGATLADVAHIRTFMTDLDDLPAYGAVRRSLFPAAPGANPPASTTVEVSRLFLPGAVLEVEVTAVVRPRLTPAGARRR
jgi:2-iminobutanoate/2-iminopropanoate deaminase